MKTINATWKNGEILPDETGDWPDGCRLRIEPLEQAQSIVTPEEDWSNSPEAIADWLQWYESLQPLLFTPEEEADTDGWLRKVNDHTKAHVDRGLEDIFR